MRRTIHKVPLPLSEFTLFISAYWNQSLIICLFMVLAEIWNDLFVYSFLLFSFIFGIQCLILARFRNKIEVGV